MAEQRRRADLDLKKIIGEAMDLPDAAGRLKAAEGSPREKVLEVAYDLIVMDTDDAVEMCPTLKERLVKTVHDNLEDDLPDDWRELNNLRDGADVKISVNLDDIIYDLWSDLKQVIMKDLSDEELQRLTEAS